MKKRRYGAYSGRRKQGSGRLAILTLLFWVVSGFVMISLLHGGPLEIFGGQKDDVGKMYIGNVFPTVSRSSFESREALNPSTTQNDEAEITKNEKSSDLLKGMMGSMFPGAKVLNDDLAEEDPGYYFTPEDIEQSGTVDPNRPADSEQKEETPNPAPADVDVKKPVVIIYHTHATESYQPVTEGNFHSLKEYGTVREVGDVLTEELRKMGIQVVHDKTLHDSPSYNQSYARSLETIKTLMESYDSEKIVIDLHRDAAGYVGNVAKTVKINNDTIAGYSLVIGTSNPNVEALRSLANEINRKAEEMYPGFGGKIIEKPYKFNQYVADNHILLEVGNNENTIEQTKETAKYFAKVLAEVIKERQ